jgi:glycosyltransferase involved in cell wall biosynthesis
MKNHKKLFLEPYYGGSHKVFADQHIQDDSDWKLLTLPATKWRWRMRHAAIEFAKILNAQYADHEWEQVFATDMMNFAEFVALAPKNIRDAEKILYFHENQLTYPDSSKTEKDYHYAFTNFVSATAADKIVFNSHYHKNEFLTAVKQLLKRMPDYSPIDQVDEIALKSSVLYPPTNISFKPQQKNNDAPIITWAARWEEDKNPKDFFDAIDLLVESGAKFRINVMGGNSESSSIGYIFDAFKMKYATIIDVWGFPSRAEYEQTLSKTNIFVSTALHEFYGITAVEAHQAGAFCVLPNRLAYPEVFAEKDRYVLYDGTVEQLAKAISFRFNEYYNMKTEGIIYE